MERDGAWEALTLSRSSATYGAIIFSDGEASCEPHCKNRLPVRGIVYGSNARSRI
jgi:hypothetical protein